MLFHLVLFIPLHDFIVLWGIWFSMIFQRLGKKAVLKHLYHSVEGEGSEALIWATFLSSPIHCT